MKKGWMSSVGEMKDQFVDANKMVRGRRDSVHAASRGMKNN